MHRRIRTASRSALPLVTVVWALGSLSVLVPGATSASPAGVAVRPAHAASRTVWLCRPGRAAAQHLGVAGRSAADGKADAWTQLGYHLDVNLALGNLVVDVAHGEPAYRW